MKTQNTNFYRALDQNQLDSLVKEVKETVAPNVHTMEHKTAFGLVDLWKLERSRRNRVIRRHLA
ncbi:MAG: hypothetical protein RLZZ28_2223 [Bacteroidota bacterium]|jgi:hypothetical protein